MTLGASLALAQEGQWPWSISAAVLIAAASVAAVSNALFTQLLPYALVILMLYLYRLEGEKPRLLYSEQLAAIVSKCESLQSHYSCTPWAWSAHVQATLFALWPQMHLQHRQHRVEHKRELVPTRDGGQIALDWCKVGEGHSDGHSEASGDPDVIILMLPGIVGKVGNAYLVRFAQFLHSKRGLRWQTVVKSWRGFTCAVTSNQPRAETWDIHSVEDTIDAAQHIRSSYPKSKLVCMGWSHGGNICLGALAEAPGLFDAGVTVSSPYDLEATMTFLEQDQWFPYAYVNTKAIQQAYDAAGVTANLAKDLPHSTKAFQEIDSVLASRNLPMHPFKRRPYGSTWHDNITRRYSGHDTVEEYYRSVTSMVKEALPQIRTPVLCLLAEDDSVTPPHTYNQFLNVASSPWVAYLLTKRGGHCGWFHGIFALSWLDDVAFDFFQTCLECKRPM
jgi:predicted alpha/beta-fold hydrolase